MTSTNAEKQRRRRADRELPVQTRRQCRLSELSARSKGVLIPVLPNRRWDAQDSELFEENDLRLADAGLRAFAQAEEVRCGLAAALYFHSTTPPAEQRFVEFLRVLE